MKLHHSLALALAASIFSAPLGALAQSAPAQPAPAQPQPQPQTPGQPQPQQPQLQPATGSPTTTTPGTIPPSTEQPQPLPLPQQQPGSLNPQSPSGPSVQARPLGSNISGGGLPAPPVPYVLPAVPAMQQNSPAITVVPNGDFVGVNQQPFVGLSLQDALVMALQRNTQLAVAQSNRRIANYQIVAANGAYDVNFVLVPSYAHSVSPVVSPFSTTSTGGPVTQDTAGATAALRGITRQGGQYSAGIVGTRVSSDSAYNSYNPFYQTALQFAVTQPLGRGRAVNQPRVQLELAQINAAQQNSTALLDASNTLVAVQNTYYDLVSAWQNVAIQEQGLRQSTAQAQSNARLAARGAVAPTDVVEANTQVNVFQDNVFAAIQSVQRAQTALKTLLLGNPGDPVWMANLVPTTPVAQIPVEPTLDALVTSAIRNRPEIAQLRAARTQSEINLAFAKDQLRPQLDIGLGYTSNGFAGQPLPPGTNPLFGLLGQVLPPGSIAKFGSPPSYQTGSLGQSLTNAFNNRFPSYSAQLTFSLPIGQHTAKADYAIAQEQQRQVALNETGVVQRVRSEAVNAIQGLREAQYRVIAARAARAASERVLLGEERRFQAGTSTTFLVLQRQLEVANQRGRELQATTDLDKAIVELQRVSGSIFAQNNIDVNTVGSTSLDAAGQTTTLPK